MEAAKEITMFPIPNTIKENQDTGFVCIYRSIKNHWVWKDNRVKTTFEAWIDLILRASHNDQKEPIGVDFILVKKGQVLTSQLQLSKEWFWSRKKVNHFLQVLQKDRMITLNATTKWSMITVCNYASYQAIRTTKEQQKNNNGTSKEHIQPLEPFKPSSTPAKPEVFVFSHNGFFDRQLEANKDQPEVDKYKKLVEFLHATDDEGEGRFENVLKIKKQISFKDYLQLKDIEKSSSRTLKAVLEGIENYDTGKKPYRNLFLTAKDWLNKEFKNEK